MYKMAATKRWTVYLGAGCIIKKRSNEYVIATPLEIITDTWTTTTVAPMLLSRCNYKLNKHISLELEMNTYWARLIHERELVYPLTPSLGGHRITNTYDYSYSLPANLWFKYSL